MVDAPLWARLESEIHIWYTEPESITDTGTLASYASLLSSDERARHGQFRLARDRHSFLVSHALVRNALSKYCKNDPASWRFLLNAHGRPELDVSTGVQGLRFNLTHTPGLSACVITRNLSCGIDAEHLSAAREIQKIAARMFASAEIASLGDFEGASARQRFFLIWTLREAYCKALGLGLAGSTKDFQFDIRDDSHAEIRFAQATRGDACDWQFSLLRPTAKHVAAIALHRPGLPDRKVVIWPIVP